MIKLVVFDMAGTTVDEDNVVYKTLMRALNESGFNFDLETVLKIGAGQEKRQAIKDLAHSVNPDFTEDKIDLVFSDFKSKLKNAYRDLDVKPQPGTDDLFDFLRARGIKIALNTGYDRPTAESLVRKIGWQEGKDFDLLVTASDVKGSRPAPDMIDYARAQFGIEEAESVAKVGDSIIDIEEGRNAGCGMTVGITTGAHQADQLQSANPSLVIDALATLKAHLSQAEKTSL